MFIDVYQFFSIFDLNVKCHRRLGLNLVTTPLAKIQMALSLRLLTEGDERFL